VKRLIIWSIIGTGISSIAIQLITIREFLSQFHGNEITISLVLFCWLFITAIGSLLARPVKKASLVLYAFLCLVIALWPLLQLVFIRGFREAIFIYGLYPGLYQTLIYILLTITPYCLSVGFVLTYAQKILNTNEVPFTSGELYISDNIGDIIGGILFSFILVYWAKPFKSIAFCSGLLVLVTILILFNTRRVLGGSVAILSTGIFYFFLLNTPFEMSTLNLQYGNIVRYMESVYGRIVITKEGPQHTFWESGIPLYSDVDIIHNEEKIHYPLSQLERAERILLVSGGLGESQNEISKYHPKEVDYVDLDPLLIKSAEGLGFINRKPFLNIINIDARSHIKKAEKEYDAIIVDFPDPDNFQINRFFTGEFFSYAKRALKDSGILAFGTTYSPNYISDVRKKKLSVIFNTARMHFKNVLVLPGEEAYFLCRDGELQADIPALLAERSIQTSWVADFYHEKVTEDRIKKIREVMDEKEYINTDFEPRIMNIVFQEWFMRQGTSPKVFLTILLGLVVLYLLFVEKEEYVLFSTGLATMGVEMLVIFIFQVIYGTIYLKVGSIITVFLMGLLPGTIIGNLTKDKSSRIIILTEVIQLLLLFIFFIWLRFFKSELHQLYYMGYGFAFAFFCGYQFPAVAEIIGEEKGPAAGCLTADLMGAAVGTLAIGTLLIPL
jgi:spermidine synthase